MADASTCDDTICILTKVLAASFQEKISLLDLHKLILQISMCILSDVCSDLFFYFNILCIRTAKAPARQCKCTTWTFDVRLCGSTITT